MAVDRLSDYPANASRASFQTASAVWVDLYTLSEVAFSLHA